MLNIRDPRIHRFQQTTGGVISGDRENTPETTARRSDEDPPVINITLGALHIAV
jgi:hypothetical protein